MKSAKSRRQLTLLTLVVALGVAVYLNWQYAKNDTSLLQTGDTPVNTSANSVAIGANAPEVLTVADGTDMAANAGASSGVTEALPDKNYGDAQLVSAGAGSVDEYFEQARLTRTKTRDEALDKLQKSMKNANLAVDEKAAITENLTAVIAGITTEGDIENLLKAKGFTECVAFIDGENVNVAVKRSGDGLTPDSVVQIRDVVLSKVETEAKNITVVEVK